VPVDVPVREECRYPARVERARRFALVVLAGVAAFVVVAWVSRWTWRAGPDWLRSGGTTFVVPWLIVLGVAAMVWPEARVPWRPAAGAWRSPRTLLVVLGALGGVAWLYAGMLAQIAERGCVPPPMTMGVLSGIVLGPVVEEWIFRGILWQELVPAGPPPPRSVVLAAVVTSALFAIWHLPFNPAAPLLAHGLFGAIMAVVRWQLGGLLPCVALHGAANTIYFLVPRG
jgi:membrane protease YdiL (CAAX protease family)